jgi:hypothetical protein
MRWDATAYHAHFRRGRFVSEHDNPDVEKLRKIRELDAQAGDWAGVGQMNKRLRDIDPSIAEFLALQFREPLAAVACTRSQERVHRIVWAALEGCAALPRPHRRRHADGANEAGDGAGGEDRAAALRSPATSCRTPGLRQQGGAKPAQHTQLPLTVRRRRLALFEGQLLAGENKNSFPSPHFFLVRRPKRHNASQPPSFGSSVLTSPLHRRSKPRVLTASRYFAEAAQSRQVAPATFVARKGCLVWTVAIVHGGSAMPGAPADARRCRICH